MWFPFLHWPLTSPLLLAVAVAACGGGEDITGTSTGTLEVTSSTTGPQPDVDGYSLQLDAEPTKTLGPASTLRRTEIAPGAHTVLLGGVAANCTIEGANPRTVHVTSGQTATILFEVSCNATTGTLRITSTTSGTSPDADGYTVTIDGTDRGMLGANSAVTHDQLILGTHFVGLNAVAGNCRVEGENPRPILVSTGETPTVAFIIGCVAPPSSAGTLRITTTTTGLSPDPEGYAFRLDGAGTQPIAANATTTVPSLAVGAHLVELLNVAANCSVQGTNPRALAIAVGTTTDVAFVITCVATSGSITVITTSLGPAADPDGYTVLLDEVERGRIGASATINLTGVTSGMREVGLGGLAPGCLAQGDNPQNVLVEPGGTATVRFHIGCVITTGAVEVTTVTVGNQLDPDGFMVSVDQSAEQAIGVNATLTISAVAPGAHTVKLSGLATNCLAQMGDLKPVTVIAGDRSKVSFSVRCPAPVSGYVAMDLGTLGGKSSSATAINAAGQIVGTADLNDRDTHAFFWDKGVMTDLGTLDGGTYSVAVDINASGQVVGTSIKSSIYRSFLWEQGVMTELPLSVNALNDAGDVVGGNWVPGVQTRFHAFSWVNGRMTDLGTLGGNNSNASAINNGGMVVGNSVTADGDTHGFLWADGIMTDLGTTGSSSYAVDINGSGDVAGTTTLANRENRAVVWVDGVMQVLGTLGGANSQAYGINDAGQVVGGSETSYGETHAFLWENGVMKDLGTLGGSYSKAEDINDAGQIVGTSDTPKGEGYATLWVPN